MNDVTFVIPVFKIEKKRLRNFFFVLSRIMESKCKIVIVEQESDNQLEKIELNNVDHVIVESNKDVIEKSKLINWSLNLINTEYVWVNDVDLWLPFDKIIKKTNFNSIAIKPFEYFSCLNNEESENFISRKKVMVDPHIHESISNFGAGSFIVNSSILNDNKFNEDFIGWGYEDIEWEERIRKLFLIYELPYVGVHLYHDKNHKNRKCNKAVYEKLHNS